MKVLDQVKAEAKSGDSAGMNATRVARDFMSFEDLLKDLKDYVRQVINPQTLQRSVTVSSAVRVAPVVVEDPPGGAQQHRRQLLHSCLVAILWRTSALALAGLFRMRRRSSMSTDRLCRKRR